MNSVLNAVVGEWQLSGIYSLHGGFPLTIRANDTTGTGSRGGRANCLLPVQFSVTEFVCRRLSVVYAGWYAHAERHFALAVTARFVDPARIRWT